MASATPPKQAVLRSAAMHCDTRGSRRRAPIQRLPSAQKCHHFGPGRLGSKALGEGVCLDRSPGGLRLSPLYLHSGRHAPRPLPPRPSHCFGAEAPRKRAAICSGLALSNTNVKQSVANRTRSCARRGQPPDYPQAPCTPPRLCASLCARVFHVSCTRLFGPALPPRNSRAAPRCQVVLSQDLPSVMHEVTHDPPCLRDPPARPDRPEPNAA